jgi:hypothetical protein
MREYLKTHPEQVIKNKARGLKRIRQSRLNALQKIAGDSIISCCNCGCIDLRVLEINHKEGNGSKELRSIGNRKLYLLIERGERPVDDLDIRCRVCNNLAYIESKFPDIVGLFKITFKTK